MRYDPGMRRTLHLTAQRGLTSLALLVLASCGSDGPRVIPGDIVDGVDTRLANMVIDHNRIRVTASPSPSPALEPVTWDDTLAAEAQAYAEQCNFEHDRNRGPNTGENLSVNAPPGWQTGTDVVEGWAEEAEDYDYGSGTCSGVCGHYTQIVWRESVTIGCGVATCDGVSGFTSGLGELWVCRYRPAGNVGSRRPY